VQLRIKKLFNQFLRTYQDEHNQYIYEGRIHELATNNKQSLEVTFMHLSEKYPTIAIWLAEEPSLVLPIFDHVAYTAVLEMYPEYYKIAAQIFVKIKELPVEDKLRDLR
jgi:DNA replication licensing factor MCM2